LEQEKRPGRSGNSSPRKYIAYVVPHTHWDRAWYLPFEEFRIKLVQTVDKLLRIFQTNARFTAFSFDGQTVVLEDYLQIRPESERPLKKLIGEGKLAVGPWYILPDEFLVSGEALIRNLLIGHKIASDFGSVMKVGYIPDTFGHISQMPQILRGFGIDSVLFSRGAGRRVKQAGLVFQWVAPEGRSWVYAVLQPGMYVNLGLWGVPQGEEMDTPNVDYGLALEQFERLVDRMEKWRPRTRVLLLNNGLDHAPAQPNVPDMIDYVNSNQNRATAVQGTFEHFVEALRRDVRSLETVTGELHEGMEAYLLSGIFSSRMYIMQTNAATQNLLEKWSEPLSTFAWSLGRDYPAAFLLYAWKELLKCHPHDDIGGCSVDSVHQDDMDRFRRVRQVGETLASQSLDHIARHIRCPEGNGILVYNPLGFANTSEIKLSFFLRKGELPRNVNLLDPSGAEVPAIIKWSPFPENLPPEKQSNSGQLEVAFLAEDVPPCGYRRYTFAEGRRNESPRRDSSGGNAVENEFFRVTANRDGTVNVKDKDTGITHKGLNFFEDVEDAGDEYDYSPLPAFRSLRITSRGEEAQVTRLRPSPYKQSMKVSLELRVPRGLKPDRAARSGQTVLLPVRSTVTVYKGIRRVDFETVVENRARDHRVRAGFPTGISAMSAYADSKFDVVRRSLRIPRYTERYYQPPVATNHFETFVDVHNGGRGFALLNYGLPEYEARREARAVTLYQTLFRSVGWLSRPDLLTRRGGGAGPSYLTPEAQMMGTWTFRYSLVPHRGSWQEARLWEAGQSFTTPMAAHFAREAGGRLPQEFSFLSIDPQTIPVTAVKKSESGQGIIVRFYNPTSKKIGVRLHFHQPIAEAYLVRLDETRLKKLKVVKGNEVVAPVAGKEIITVALHPRV
jgi:mannosylglycerate hydrolase